MASYILEIKSNNAKPIHHVITSSRVTISNDLRANITIPSLVSPIVLMVDPDGSVSIRHAGELFSLEPNIPWSTVGHELLLLDAEYDSHPAPFETETVTDTIVPVREHFSPAKNRINPTLIVENNSGQTFEVAVDQRDFRIGSDPRNQFQLPISRNLASLHAVLHIRGIGVLLEATSDFGIPIEQYDQNEEQITTTLLQGIYAYKLLSPNAIFRIEDYIFRVAWTVS